MIAAQYPATLARLDFGPEWLSVPPLNDSVDPFNFQQRIAAYKRIIDDSNAHGIFGTENQYNLFWGYVVQIFWQWRTKRLSFPDTPHGCIDPDSLWGYGNHALSIIPLIGAIQAGITPDIEILPPYKASKAEYAYGGGRAGAFVIPPRFQAAVGEWEVFFRALGALRRGDDLERLRFKQWHAHHGSLRVGHDVYAILAERYSTIEYHFFLGWIRLVDFLGTAAWHTDLDYMLINGMGELPDRLLTDNDQPGAMPGLDVKVSSNVASMVNLTNQPQWRFNFNLWLWKRAMRSRAARDEVLPMLDAVFYPSSKNGAERRKLLGYILKL